MSSFPIYIIELDSQVKVVFPEGRSDIGHSEFWEQSVASLVAGHYGVPQSSLANLPYCQRRARVVGNTVYYGEAAEEELLRLIRKAVGNVKLAFCYDDHEKRLREDVREFNRLRRKFSISR